MTTQQNNSLINLMLNGELTSHFIVDNYIMVNVYRENSFQFIYLDEAGKEVEGV